MRFDFIALESTLRQRQISSRAILESSSPYLLSLTKRYIFYLSLNNFFLIFIYSNRP